MLLAGWVLHGMAWQVYSRRRGVTRRLSGARHGRHLV